MIKYAVSNDHYIWKDNKGNVVEVWLRRYNQKGWKWKQFKGKKIFSKGLKFARLITDSDRNYD
jgi:hypothetical protein|tara:strand:- start:461 stop:649 length:189 start_codon:yes stop_codon:yes gene_type:complete